MGDSSVTCLLALLHRIPASLSFDSVGKADSSFFKRAQCKVVNFPGCGLDLMS